MSAHEVRPLGLVTLRARNGGYRAELPVSGSAATRFRARGFPFGICHRVLLRVRAAACSIAFAAALRAEARAIFIAREHQGKRRIDQLPDEVRHVEFVAVQDVVLAERVVAPEARIEPFLQFEVERKFHRFETPGTFARGSSVDRSLQFQTSCGTPNPKSDVSGKRKPKVREVGQRNRLPNLEFASGKEYAADIDGRSRTFGAVCRGPSPPRTTSR